MNRNFIAIFLTSFFLLVSCTKDGKKGQKYLLPWPNQQGVAELQYIEIQTLNSPYELSGPAAKIYYQASISDTGFDGDVAQPRISSTKEGFVPLDTASSVGLTLYAHMERIQQLDFELGIQSLVMWPRKIGYGILLQNKDATTLEYNNARYFLDPDIIAFVPMASESTPLSVNPGILAHEHFHAYFNMVVLRPIEAKPQQETSTTAMFNEDVILRGWNEGLSDYYGFVYSKNPEFLKMSLGGAINIQRKIDVEEPIAIKSSKYFLDHYQFFVSSDISIRSLGYLVGTDISRTLFRLVESADKDSPLQTHKQMLQYVALQMHKIADYYYKSHQQKPIEPVELLDLIFFSEAEPILTQSQCEALVELAPYYFQQKKQEVSCFE